MAKLGNRLGICGMIGTMAGFIGGGIFSLINFLHEEIRPTTQELVYMILVLTFFVWLIILFFLFALARLRVRGHFMTTFLNVFLVLALTAYICGLLGVVGWAWLIGPALGMFVGGFLCSIMQSVYR